MTLVMIIFMIISTLVAIALSLFVCVQNVRRGRTLPIKFSSVDTQIGSCRISSIVFAVLAWVAASCRPRSECFKEYVEIARYCMYVGSAWLVFAFGCVVICIIMIDRKKGTALTEDVSKFRNTGFVMGALFLIVSFLLNVQ